MTPDDLKSFLESNKEDIQLAVKQATIGKLIEQHRWDISEQVTKVVREFVAEEVIPAVKAELGSQRGAIIESTLTSLASISDNLAKSLSADAAKRIGSEWDRKKIISAIFGI